jgi:hypothetical protein
MDENQTPSSAEHSVLTHEDIQRAERAEVLRQEILNLQTFFELQVQNTKLSMEATKELVIAVKDVFEALNNELEAWRTDSKDRSERQQAGVEVMAEKLQHECIAFLIAKLRMTLESWGQ